MPEFPDLELYRAHLTRRIVGQPLERLRIGSPFVLRTVEPPAAAFEGQIVREIRRIGKRLVIACDGELFVVVHLMVAGRLAWAPHGAKLPARAGLMAVDFPQGTLLLTEVSTHKRAAVHLVRGEASLSTFDRGGLEVMTCHVDEFADRLRLESHTLKRALTDPRLFSAIGNAYSDEILHRAKLSPVKLSRTLAGEEVARLFEACRGVLHEWSDRLAAQAGDAWPEKVTAFRPEMAVHGRFKLPCPVCGAAVQRIVHADNETDYCPRCQNAGRLLADRALSKLLHEDWPKTLDDLEEYVASRGGPR